MRKRDAMETRSELWSRRVLDDLVYERIRLMIDLCELKRRDTDLVAGIGLALERFGSERDAVTARALERAWARVGREAAACAAGCVVVELEREAQTRDI